MSRPSGAAAGGLLSGLVEVLLSGLDDGPACVDIRASGLVGNPTFGSVERLVWGPVGVQISDLAGDQASETAGGQAWGTVEG